MSTEGSAASVEVRHFAPPQHLRATSFDCTLPEDDIKQSFLLFSLKVHELEEQLRLFADGCQKLDSAARLLHAIKKTRRTLRPTREVFFHNATALIPDLLELAREDCSSKAKGSNSECFYIRPKYFNKHLQYSALPKVLERLGKCFIELHSRIEAFREFTDEGLYLKTLLMTLHGDLMYRVSCVKIYSKRMDTPPIQHYIHQFVNELQADFEKLTVALGIYTTVGIPTISRNQARYSSSIANMLTFSTLFSGITASALQMSTGRPDQNNGVLITNLLWFMSLVFSIGAAFNNLMAINSNHALSTNSGDTAMRFLITSTWLMDISQPIFLELSIATFSAGLIVFVFASSQASYTPYLVLTCAAVTCYPVLASLFHGLRSLHLQSSLKSYGDSDSDPSKHGYFYNLFVTSIKIPLRINRRKQLSLAQFDVERVEENLSEPKDSLTRDHNVQGGPKMKVQGVVKSAGVMRASRGILPAAGQKKKHRHNEKLEIYDTSATVPLTQLILPDEPTLKIEFAQYGPICDLVYSDDGKWLAITCANKTTATSRTAVYDAETLTCHLDTSHQGRVLSEHLKWSPSGKQLMVKFERRCDILDLDLKVLNPVERHHTIQDVAWFSEDVLLIAERDSVFKINSNKTMAVYRFEHTHIRSIALVKDYNYLALITEVARSGRIFEPASARSEKRVIIYDMDKEKEIYVVPVLEDISSIYSIPGTLDIMITRKEQQRFQLWSLDVGSRGAENTATLKKRVAITPHSEPKDYMGPICLAGTDHQFVLNVAKSGEIDIWRRETGMPYLRFQPPILRDNGVHCFSWRRSNDRTATFATAGIDSHILLVWRGEEQRVPKTPASLELPIGPGPNAGVDVKSGSCRVQAVHIAGGTSGPLDTDVIEETIE